MLMHYAEIPKGHKNDYFQSRFSLGWFLRVPTVCLREKKKKNAQMHGL